MVQNLDKGCSRMARHSVSDNSPRMSEDIQALLFTLNKNDYFPYEYPELKSKLIKFKDKLQFNESDKLNQAITKLIKSIDQH